MIFYLGRESSRCLAFSFSLAISHNNIQTPTFETGHSGKGMCGMAIRRKPKTLPILFFILILLSVIGFGGYYGWIHWSRNVAIRTVQDFYAAEQGGDYGKAWTMLHSDMKKKFNQSEYIQKRTALFIDSFGAKTF